MLKIGPLEFRLPAVQAALSGYSDRAMRVVGRRWGAELAMAEVVLDQLVLLKGKLRDRMLGIGDDDHPIGGQLMGAEPTQFGRAAVELVEHGYDLVDINFGCPVKKVLGRCRGGYLLTTPHAALDIVKSVLDHVGGRRPVTLKMRRGFDDSAESEANFFTILDGAFDLGVASVTVHGRTVKQKYIGPSNRDFLAKVKRHAGTRTILGSGDVFGPEDVPAMMGATGVDGVWIARGAIGNPFIFREVSALLEGRPLPPPPTLAEQRAALDEHLRLTADVYGPERAGVVMRKVCIRYADLHPLDAEVRRSFIEARSSADVEAALRRWYDPDHDWPEVRRVERGAVAALSE
ncbi:MAG: tRNA-dihydrouridine synthase [Planctomycetaceae bacterium]|nr:tRNA-dihydrouridine synthase [Planctomycetaceae bacterium]